MESPLASSGGEEQRRRQQQQRQPGLLAAAADSSDVHLEPFYLHELASDDDDDHEGGNDMLASSDHQKFGRAEPTAPATAQPNTTGGKNKKLFPQKLWDLIHDDKYNFCLRWSDDGQLVYLNRDEFEDSYLKTNENQFHTQKAISFVRQMNMYGFRKVDDCYYENDNFKRNCEYLLKNMIRKHPTKNQQQHQSASHTIHTIQEQQPIACGLDDSTNPFQSLYQRRLNQQSILQPPAQHKQTASSFNQHMNSSSTNNDFNECNDALLDPLAPANLPAICHSQQHKELIQVLLSQQKQQLYQQPPKEQHNYHHHHHQLLHQQQQQQSNTQYPRDLTTLPSFNNKQQVNSQTDLINLNAFYALVSSINSNIYQEPGQLNQTMSPDINKLAANAQQIYQQLIAQQLDLDSSKPIISQQQDCETFSNTTNMNAPPMTHYLENLAHNFANKDDVSTNMTSPIQDKSIASATRSGKRHMMNNLDDTSTVGDLMIDNHADIVLNKTWPNTNSELQMKAREVIKSRPFKRSVHSLLDGNNNNSPEEEPDDFGKRIKILNSSNSGEEDNLRRVMNKYAKNLVKQVVSMRDAKVDTLVIAEASRYTEQFVETLFDTAQVIARHSNCSKLADNRFSEDIRMTKEKKDLKQDKETERSNINLSDLTSALKLLPSKILKLL